MDISDRNEQIITTSKPITYLMLALAGLIGGGGLLILMIVLFGGSFNIVDLGMGTIQVLVFDIFLCLLFFYSAQPHGSKAVPFMVEKLPTLAVLWGFLRSCFWYRCAGLSRFLAGSYLHNIFASRFHTFGISRGIRPGDHRRSLDHIIAGFLCQFPCSADGG